MTEREMVAQFAEAAYKAGQESKKMLDDEINSAVARKLGWKKFDEHYSYWIPPTIEATHKYGDRPSHLPLYTKQIAAAWEVVEKMGEMVELYRHNGKWTCDYGRKLNGESDTAPMAICLAFLKLTGGK